MKIRGEDGNILILSALIFTFLIAFVAIAVDIGIMYTNRTKLLEIGNLMRDARFQQTEFLWNSYNPAYDFDSLVKEYGLKNGLTKEQIKTVYRIIENTKTTRRVEVDIELTSIYKCTTLKLFGYNEIVLKEKIEGYGYKVKSPEVWKP